MAFLLLCGFDVQSIFIYFCFIEKNFFYLFVVFALFALILISFLFKSFRSMTPLACQYDLFILSPSSSSFHSRQDCFFIQFYSPSHLFVIIISTHILYSIHWISVRLANNIWFYFAVRTKHQWSFCIFAWIHFQRFSIHIRPETDKCFCMLLLL